MTAPRNLAQNVALPLQPKRNDRDESYPPARAV